MKEIIKGIDLLSETEKYRGEMMYGPNHSRHEGIAVFQEEFDEMEEEYDKLVLLKTELWNQVKDDAKRSEVSETLEKMHQVSLKMAAELVQTIAMISKMESFEEESHGKH